MSIQEIVTAGDTKFVEVNRIEWLMFLQSVKPTSEPLQTVHADLTAGAMKASADVVIVYRSQAKSLAGLTTETAP
jgi:hypothetical protein